MINKNDIGCIENLLNNKVIHSKLLSNSFNINCIKITTENKKNYICKYYNNSTNDFNAIKSETKNLIYLNNLNLNFFPSIIEYNDKYLIMSCIEHDGFQPNNTETNLLNAIISIHKFTNNKYGLKFDTQIGGLKQINNQNKNWVDFYRDLRLGYIYNLINLSEPMSANINDKMDRLIKNLSNFIPNEPKASLLHGDLWEGNILFHNKKFIGFIDPGTFYGHNELEIAYLTWFNPKFIKNDFINKYNDIIKINKEYFSYEPIYQLYYSLLNVYLWDRNYVHDVKRLLDKIKI